MIRDVQTTPVRFLATFFALTGLFALIARASWVMDEVRRPLSVAIATLTEALLAPFGVVARKANTIVFDGFAVAVVDACDGVQPTYIYVAAVLAFPALWRERLVGVAAGGLLVFVANLVRVASLLVLGAHWPAAFDRVHLYVWQLALVLLAMGVWIFWVERIVSVPAVDATPE